VVNKLKEDADSNFLTEIFRSGTPESRFNETYAKTVLDQIMAAKNAYESSGLGQPSMDSQSPTPQANNFVIMQSPDGQRKQIPVNQIAEAEQYGYVRI